jgi:hypothetical protein
MRTAEQIEKGEQNWLISKPFFQEMCIQTKMTLFVSNLSWEVFLVENWSETLMLFEKEMREKA